MILFYDSQCCCYISIEPLHPSGKALSKPDNLVSQGLYRSRLSRYWTVPCWLNLGQAGACTPRDESLRHLDKTPFLNRPALTPATGPPKRWRSGHPRQPPGVHAAAAATTVAATFTASTSRPGRSRWATDRLRRRSALGRVSMAQRRPGATGAGQPSPPSRPAAWGRAGPSPSTRRAP